MSIRTSSLQNSFQCIKTYDLNKSAHHNVQRFKIQNVQNTCMPIYFFLRSAT